MSSPSVYTIEWCGRGCMCMGVSVLARICMYVSAGDPIEIPKIYKSDF